MPAFIGSIVSPVSRRVLEYTCVTANGSIWKYITAM